MEANNHVIRDSTHPMVVIAALAIILFCGVGIAAVMGWLPQPAASMGPPVAEAPVQVGTRDNGPPPAPAGYAAATAPETSGYSASGSQGAGAALDERAPTAQHAAAPAVCHSCGVVESVRSVTQRGEGSGLGAAGGAIVGGLLGNQVGGGHGRQLATVAGAVGGAVVGNQVEGNMKSTTHYQVRVRMDDGKVRTVTSSAASWQAGDPVKVVKGRLQRR